MLFVASGAYDVGALGSGGREPLGTLTGGGRVGLSELDDGRTVHGALSRRGRFALRDFSCLNRFAPQSGPHAREPGGGGGITKRIGNAELQAVGFRHRMNDGRGSCCPMALMRVNRDGWTAGLSCPRARRTGCAGSDLMLQSVPRIPSGTTNRPRISQGLRQQWPRADCVGFRRPPRRAYR
jgi:hypothetical protein